MVDTLVLETRPERGASSSLAIRTKNGYVTQLVQSAFLTRKKSGVRIPPYLLKDSFSKQKLVKNSHLKCERSGSNPQN